MSDARTRTADQVSSRAGPGRPRTALAQALRRPRYEVLPLADTPRRVEQHVPRDIPLTVTASPRRGLEATLATAEWLSARGYAVVPHLPARLVVDEAHVREILWRSQAAGITEVFVVAGDGQPVGAFTDAAGLLAAMHRVALAGLAPRMTQVGIAGYPDGHPFIGAADLFRALLDKQPLATYAVSQMCFDARTISTWVTNLRRRGVRLPLYVGVTGAVDKRRLLRIAGRIGVGPSARFLRVHGYGLARLLLPGGYRPTRLVRALAPDLAEPGRHVVGLHIYTLGDVGSTERWRRRMLHLLTDGNEGHE